MDFIGGEIISGIIGTIIGALLGYLGKASVDSYRIKKRNKFVVDFFGLKNKKKTRIVHSVIFDNIRNAYAFPMCDAKVTSIVVGLLESIGLREGEDFAVNSDIDLIKPDGEFKAEVMEDNLILICGPKRNKLTAKMLNRLPKIHYELSESSDKSRNIIYDIVRNSELISTQDSGNVSTSGTLIGHDFGLIVSASDQVNMNRNIVVLAGIHGSGTLGAGIFIEKLDNIRELCGRRKQGLIQEVVVANYKGHMDNITNVNLA